MTAADNSRSGGKKGRDSTTAASGANEAVARCVPTVGDTRYGSGALGVRNVSDGVEFTVHLPIGPVFVWVSHEDAQKLAGVADPNDSSEAPNE